MPEKLPDVWETINFITMALEEYMYMLTNNIGSLELEKFWQWRESLLYNSLDKHAVSVLKHIPYNMAPIILSFLRGH